MISLDENMLKYLQMQRPSYAKMDPSMAADRMRHEISRFISINKQWIDCVSRVTRPRILDIGAGIGFGTAALFEVFGKDGSYYILDKSELAKPGELYYGYQEEAAPYNDLKLTRDFLLGVGVPAKKLYVCDAGKPQGFPENTIFDLVMAHISWGFHFPVSTYYEQVRRATRRGSIVYLDLRKGTDGAEILRNDFDLVWSSPASKSESTAWVKR